MKELKSVGKLFLTGCMLVIGAFVMLLVILLGGSQIVEWIDMIFRAKYIRREIATILWNEQFSYTLARLVVREKNRPKGFLLFPRRWANRVAMQILVTQKIAKYSDWSGHWINQFVTQCQHYRRERR